MAITGQVVPFTGGLAEITNCFDTREKLDSALKDLGDEMAKFNPDLAKQIAADSAGKSKLDLDAVLTKYKALEAKRDQLKEKVRAMTIMREAVAARLEELKSSSPAEFDQVLAKRIAEQEKVRDKAQEEARRADEKLTKLVAERAGAEAAAPAAPPPAPAAPAAPAATTSEPSNTTAAVAPADTAAVPPAPPPPPPSAHSRRQSRVGG